LHLGHDTNIYILNTIIWDEIERGSYSSPQVEAEIYSANSHYLESSPWDNDLGGNTDTDDPNFFDPSGDWHLRASSPCQDQISSLPFADLDIEKHPRPGLLDNDDSKIDKGCYEDPSPSLFGMSMFIHFPEPGRYPGFPKDIPFNPGNVLSNVEETVGLLKELGVTLARINLPWNMLEPVEDKYVFEWDASSQEFQISDDFTSTSDSEWTNNLSVIPSEICTSGCDTADPAVSEGNLKAVYRTYYLTLDAYFKELKKHNIRILATFQHAPIWHNADYANFTPAMNWESHCGSNFFDCLFASNFYAFVGRTKELTTPVSLSLNGFRAGDPESNYFINFSAGAETHLFYNPDFAECLARVEDRWGEEIDYYALWSEPSRLGWNYSGGEYWRLLKDARKVLDAFEDSPSSPTNKPKNKLLMCTWTTEGPNGRGSQETFLNEFFSSISKPTDSEKKEEFQTVCSIYSMHPHLFSPGNHILHLEGDSIGNPGAQLAARRILDNVRFLRDYEYNGLKMSEGLPLMIDEIGFPRCWAGDCSTRILASNLFDQNDNIHDAIFSQDVLYELFNLLAKEPELDIMGASWYDNSGNTGRDGVAMFWDSALHLQPFSLDHKETEIIDQAPSTWVHPIFQETKGNLADPVDFYWNSNVNRLPMFYGYKAVTHGLGNLEIPQIVSITYDEILLEPWETLRIEHIGTDLDDKETLVLGLDQTLPQGTKVTLVMDGIKLEEKVLSSSQHLLSFTPNFTKEYGNGRVVVRNLTEGEKAALSTVSRYHRLSLLISASFFGEEYVDAGFNEVETMYRHFAIEDDETVDPDFFAPSTPIPTVPTPTPDGKYNDYQLIAGFDFKSQTDFDKWGYRSFTAEHGYDFGTPTVTPTHVNLPIPTPPNTPVGVVLYGNVVPDTYSSGDLNHPDAPTYCPNFGGEITANPTEFSYGELDCQVKWHIDKWEGGEMWTASSLNISNYQDILVKYYFDASVEDTGQSEVGISEMPHGFIPYSLYPVPTGTPVFSPPSDAVGDEVFLPYSCCRGLAGNNFDLGLKSTTNCADSCFMEQMLMVMYSTDHTATPDIVNVVNVEDRLENIRKWQIAEVVPRKLLRRANGGSVRILDFSRQREFSQKDYLKLWFRFQTDDLNDEVRIKQVRVFGVLKPTPTP
jgi:hypothetical protein